MTLLDIAGLEVRYGDIVAVHGLDLTIGTSEALALLGANGAGKSTLIKAIIGLLRARTGTIRFDGTPIGALRADRRARLGIGYCPEGRRTFPGLTVRENLAVACWAEAAERRRRLEEAFALFPILAEQQSRVAWQLSGGQQQMLAIGRSLMNRPRLLLLDEPSLGLSPRLTEEVLGRIPQIVASGVSVLLAEQNAAKALQVCETAYVLKLGRVTQHGRAAELAASAEIRAAFLGG
ncbi:MAG TPA: ABC transporter ATP-binding protein [Acetobacteraceae bacterium]|nr:ABC transporter ATP-binding protein [Acetobacteraceae bacterium]